MLLRHWAAGSLDFSSVNAEWHFPIATLSASCMLLLWKLLHVLSNRLSLKPSIYFAVTYAHTLEFFFLRGDTAHIKIQWMCQHLLIHHHSARRHIFLKHRKIPCPKTDDTEKNDLLLGKRNCLCLRLSRRKRQFPKDLLIACLFV